jgi:hypothetical protein
VRAQTKQGQTFEDESSLYGTVPSELQNRVHQFNSGRGLHEINDLDAWRQPPNLREPSPAAVASGLGWYWPRGGPSILTIRAAPTILPGSWIFDGGRM